jgi:RIO-like serine/threonine protein kinase
MVLRLYHTGKEVHTVYNVIKVSIDDSRTMTVKIKDRGRIEYRSFRYETDYQRLTIQVD